MSQTLGMCEEMHSRECVTYNQEAECGFKCCTVRWLIFVVFPGAACLPAKKVAHARTVLSSDVKWKTSQEQEFGEEKSAILKWNHKSVQYVII